MTYRWTIALVVAVGTFCFAPAFALDAYLCTGEQATGFGFHDPNGTWSVERFQPTKLLVKRTDDLVFKWRVHDYAKDVPIINCKGDFDDEGLLKCDGVALFLMSREKMRFLYVYTLGYWSDSDRFPAYKEGTNRPWMEIGRCSPL